MEPWEMGARDLRAVYDAATTTPVEVVDALIERIERLDAPIGAFTATMFDDARRRARTCAEELKRGGEGPLLGVPVGVKELFDTAGAETTYGSLLLRGRVPEVDADAVARMRRAGAIVLGLTRSHEFAWGITTQSERGGSTRNPWDLERVPGGSSGGSAAAVAMGFVPLALGSDTGGSIRIPACFTGVAGFKASFGAVSLGGVCPLAPSLDHGGALARNIDDLVLAHEVLSGAPAEVPRVHLADRKVGVCPDLHVIPLAEDHRRVFDSAIAVLERTGAALVEVDLPGAPHIYEVFAAIQLYEAYRVHSETFGFYPRRRTEYSASVAARLELAKVVSEEEYERACDGRLEVRSLFARIFDEVDILVTPVTGGGPSFVERPEVVDYRGREMSFRELVMHYSVPQNVAGIPACALPAGFDDDGMPVGVQVSSARGTDWLCLGAAAALAEVLDRPEWPPLARA